RSPELVAAQSVVVEDDLQVVPYAILPYGWIRCRFARASARSGRSASAFRHSSAARPGSPFRAYTTPSPLCAPARSGLMATAFDSAASASSVRFPARYSEPRLFQVVDAFGDASRTRLKVVSASRVRPARA